MSFYDWYSWIPYVSGVMGIFATWMNISSFCIQCIIFNVYELKDTMVKLSLCLTKHHAQKTYWGSGGIDPRIFNRGTRQRRVASFTPRPPYHRVKNPRYHWIGGWVDPRDSGCGDKKKSHNCPWWEINLGHPACSLVSILAKLPQLHFSKCQSTSCPTILGVTYFVLNVKDPCLSLGLKTYYCDSIQGTFKEMAAEVITVVQCSAAGNKSIHCLTWQYLMLTP
jgi:hypothetical protein